MLTIRSKPTAGVAYVYSAIPIIDIDTQNEISLIIKLDGISIFTANYLAGQSGVQIENIGNMILASLVLTSTNYTFEYLLFEDGDFGTIETYYFTAYRFAIPVNIITGPENNKLYFQKNIPDFILQKSATETVSFSLKQGANTLLTETYNYDSDGYINIRNLYKVIETYLSSTQKMLDFSVAITEDGLTESRIFTVIKCEADMIVEADSWLISNFLTRAYREKVTSKNRNEYLSFLQKSSYGTVTKKFKIVYLVNGVRTELEDSWGEMASSNAIVTFNSSLAIILAAADFSDDHIILQYDIWLTGTGFDTEKYSYLVDYNNYRNKKHFVFENSFGVLETFTATGIVENKVTNEYNLANIQSHYRKTTQDFISEKTVNTGFLSSVQMDWLDDILLSYNVGIYTPGISGMSEEITITSHDKTDTGTNVLQAFSFTYRKSKNNHLQFDAAAKGIFDDTFDESFN